MTPQQDRRPGLWNQGAGYERVDTGSPYPPTPGTDQRAMYPQGGDSYPSPPPFRLPAVGENQPASYQDQHQPNYGGDGYSRPQPAVPRQQQQPQPPPLLAQRPKLGPGLKPLGPMGAGGPDSGRGFGLSAELRGNDAAANPLGPPGGGGLGGGGLGGGIGGGGLGGGGLGGGGPLDGGGLAGALGGGLGQEDPMSWRQRR